MRTLFNVHTSSKLLLTILVFLNHATYAKFPMSLENGVPKLAGVQIGMSAAQARQALAASGYTPKTTNNSITTHFMHGKDIIRFKPGKHDPVEWTGYYHRLDVNVSNLAALEATQRQYVKEFTAVFGNQAVCQGPKNARANCEFVVKQGSQIKYRASLRLRGFNNMSLTLQGNPNLAGTPGSGETAPAQQKPAWQPSFVMPFSHAGGIAKLAGVQIGMSAAQAKNVLITNGFTPGPVQYNMIAQYTQGKDSLTFQYGKHDPVAWAGYFHTLNFNKRDTAAQKASTRYFIDQFKTIFGNQSTCNDGNAGRAVCNYLVMQDGGMKYQATMQLSGYRLELTLMGNPKLSDIAAGSTQAAQAFAPAPQTSAEKTEQDNPKPSKYRITLKNNEVYINGMKLGMPEHVVKNELDKLDYKYNNKGAHQLKAGDEKSSIQAFIQRHQLKRITIREYDIAERTKNEIIKSIKTTFGARVKCQDMANQHPQIVVSCNAVIKLPGKRTSLSVSFLRQRSGNHYIQNITLM